MNLRKSCIKNHCIVVVLSLMLIRSSGEVDAQEAMPSPGPDETAAPVIPREPLAFNQKADLFIISTSSVSRLSLIETQKDTFGRHLSVQHYTELDFPDGCVFCQHKSYSLYPALYHEGPQRFEDRNLGWYCAQQRNLQALRKAMQDHYPTGTTPPRWTMLVDDDTFIDPWELLAMLSNHDHTMPMYLGNHFHAAVADFALGGAGTIISQALVQSLLAPMHTHRPAFDAGAHEWVLGPDMNDTKLDACIARQLGGSWCHKHSDWAVAACMKIAGAARPTLMPEAKMSHLHCPMLNATAGPTGLVTCHYAHADMQHKLYEVVSKWHAA